MHPNGVCLIGHWRIVEETGYSGYFSKGSTALVVARYLTCGTETRRGRTRFLSMVGKLFSTTAPHYALPLRTAEPSIRQLYPIAELGKPVDLPTRAPEFMRLMVAPH